VNRLIFFVDLWLARVLVSLLLAMVVTVSWQVASRYLFNDPSSVTEEIARFLLMWISLLGASYAYRTRMHLGLDLLVGKMSARTQYWVAQFGYGVALVFALTVMLCGGLHLVWLTWTLEQFSAALTIPMAGVYLVLPLSGLLISFYAICFLKGLPPCSNPLEETR